MAMFVKLYNIIKLYNIKRKTYNVKGGHALADPPCKASVVG